jgi:type IV secretion system protein VirB10
MANPTQPSTSGLVPTFLKRQVVNPWTGLGAAAVVGLACVPIWAHFHPADIGAMASAKIASMQSNTASASATSDKPEAPDPSPTPFPKRSVQPKTLAQVIRPQPSPVVVAQNVAVAQAAAVAVAPVPTAAPTPPATTAGDFGEPNDTEVNVPAHAAPVAPASPPVVAQSNGVGYVPATSRFELQQGGIIHARFTMHLDAEHQGQCAATIIEPVYASADPQTEIIPPGTIAIGQYGSTSSGDTRLLITWTRLNLPSGRKFAFAEPATDEMGNTGASGQVNSHFGKQLAQSALYTVINGIGNAFSRSNTVVLGGGSLTQGISGQQQQQIKPDIYITEGSRVDIVASRDLPFDAVRQ